VTTDFDALEEHLRARWGHRNVPIAAVKLVLFERIREKFGASWGRILPRVRSIVASAIERQLGTDEFGLWLSDLAYLIVFADRNTAATETRMRTTSAEISRRLLEGRDERRDLVRVITLPVAGNSVEPLDILDACRDHLADDSPNPAPPAAALGDRRRVESALATLRAQYHPIWDVRHKVLATYFCTFVPTTTEDGTVALDALLREDDAPRAVELDLRLLEQITKDLQRLHRIQRRVLMACPLHAAVLSGPHTRERFLKAYCPFPEPVRRDIIFELIGQWHGMKVRQMSDLIAHVKPFCREVTARVDLDWTHFELFRDSGIKTVAVNLSGYEESETVLIPRLNRFAEHAEWEGLQRLAHGLVSNSLAVAALGAGFSLVEGRAIHDAVDSPEHIFRFDVADLFSKLLANASSEPTALRS
jgi:hypothetical protein